MTNQHHDSPSPATVSSSTPSYTSSDPAAARSEYEGFDPELPEGAEGKRFLGLSSVQIGASALAAVTSALAASFIGVAGTLIGAAVGSIVSTVAGAMYAESIRRAGGRLREAQTVVIQRVADGSETTPQQVPPPQVLTQIVPANADETIVLPAQTAAATQALPAVDGSTHPTHPAHPGPSGADLAQTSLIRPERADATDGPGKRPWWRRPIFALPVVGISGFVIALGVITGIEGLTGNTLSGGSGTSLSRIGGSSTPASEPAATVTVTVSPSATTQPSATPTTAAPTVEPTQPTAVPTQTTAPTVPPTTVPSATGSAPAPEPSRVDSSSAVSDDSIVAPQSTGAAN